MAKGSHDTYGGWEPKVCCICSGPIVKARDASLRFHMDDVTRETFSWHRECEQERGWPVVVGGQGRAGTSREGVVTRGGVD